MIKQILQLLATCASVNILAVQTAEGKLSLTFIPKAKESGGPSMATPFNLTGTPDELEAGIASALDQINGSRETLAEQVEATNTVLAQAAKDAAEKGSKALKGKQEKPGTASKSASTASAGDSGSEDSNEDEASNDGFISGGQSASAPATAPVSAMNLFA